MVNMKNLRLRVRVAPFLILAISLVAPAAMGASDDHLHDSVPKAKATRPKLDPPARLPDVTARVYFDIEIKEKKSKPRKGRITFGLFGNVAPKAVENFMSLCECNKGNGKVSGKPLCYKGSEFHRISESLT
ncbi:hypothetical protein THAOC_15607 [Thalassiosira oceanica]|uniref:PPIase cyclophilin-type domain-containing protein n=1 Tax=Thalassiosira oceanica TaxID=159749 RepID=K0SRU2_THAOC|nr:hypothetical protein THAOC_15607 [Thalassiosira oceanica]|eukprot:EJK63721.1 hypothetical protein THAOC_15607 [Thalassiosira oceanica]